MDGVKKFYSQRAISVATFFGGPLAAGYLVKKNYEAFGQPANAQKALMIGVTSTLLLFAVIFSIPEHIIDKVPNALFPLIYTGMISLVVERLQGHRLKSHKQGGGSFYSSWKAAGIGAVSTVILLAGVGLSAFLAGDFSEGFDAAAYDNGVALFVENEEKALTVFDVLETHPPDYLLGEFQKGMLIWKQNNEIIKQLNLIENLPQELIDQNSLLLKYCDLRVQQSEIFILTIVEDTDKYLPQLEKIGSDINGVLEDLN